VAGIPLLSEELTLCRLILVRPEIRPEITPDLELLTSGDEIDETATQVKAPELARVRERLGPKPPIAALR
jgi:hypothetical protein